MKNLVIERLRDAVRDAYPPGQTTVRTADLEWLLNMHDLQTKTEAELARQIADRSAT